MTNIINNANIIIKNIDSVCLSVCRAFTPTELIRMKFDTQIV